MERWREIDGAGEEDARRLLGVCCGSATWVERMARRRPFNSREAALAAARAEWFALSREDWLEAFAHHPRIGDREALLQRFPLTHALSEGEQSGVDGAAETTLAALAAGNRAYETRFGYTFIVCATGKTASEMLAMLEQRLSNESEKELRIAAEEQARITALRLTSS